MRKRRYKLSKENLWDRQNLALRDPARVICGSYSQDGIESKSLDFKMTDNVREILGELDVTLIVTREYENLMLAICVESGRITQSFVHLAHPSGLAIDRRQGDVYVAATRNPNQIWKFKAIKGRLERKERKGDNKFKRYLIPTRVKFFCGSFYFHELAFIESELYVNSVGMNCIMKVDFSKDGYPQPAWWPKCIEDKIGKPDFMGNYIQLNSIGAGRNLSSSYFSAFSETKSKVPRTLRLERLISSSNKSGVIFSGESREVWVKGLTHPHSVRIRRGVVWVCDSGYGELIGFKDGMMIERYRIPGWTRGLCFLGKYAFVGSSRVLPDRNLYAPGLKSRTVCGVYVIDLNKKKIVGSITWPYGNQIFSVDWVSTKQSVGFPFHKVEKSNDEIEDLFYTYIM